MKIIRKIGVLLLSISLVALLWNCSSQDDEFIHNSNMISQMVCKASNGGSEYLGKIYEYDKDGNLMSGSFTQEKVEGGYGLILFPISKSLKADVDLTTVFLNATVSYDEIITPSLYGKHDISGEEGIIVTVKSGVGTTRKYRIRGYYE